MNEKFWSKYRAKINKLQSYWSLFIDAILDTLMPRRCACCGQLDTWLCDTCLRNISRKTTHKCHYCKKVSTKFGEPCHSCRGKTHLSNILVATNLSDKLITKAIHLYKYRFIPELHIQLGELIANTIVHSTMPLPDIIIPVPLHPRRLRWRGFNQSALLAQTVAKSITPGITIPVRDDILLRVRYTPPQVVAASRAQRQQNIIDAFQVVNPKDITNKTILLIDDIATTGTTLEICARTLKHAGTRTTYSAVIARG